jgi:hypothetical protein
MRKLFTLAVAALISAMAWSVTPEKMSYQAVIRNSSEQLVVNKKVGMRISILQNSETGTAVYTETQTPTTNANGLVSLEIGAGKSSNNFSTVDWSDGPFFIKTETDPSGGTNYTISGVSQLLSVPYALYAKTVEIDKVDDADADPTNEIQVLSKTGNTVTLSKTGGSFTDAVDDADADPANEIQTLSISGTSLTLSKGGQTVTLPSSGGGDNWGTQTAVTNATLEGNGSTASPLKIAQQGATAGQALKWNGTAWAPGDDAAGSSGLTLPYSKTVGNNDFAFSVTNSLNSAIKGSSSSATGITYGVYGNSASLNGTGVFGSNESLTGETYGVNGIASSPDGAGIYGYNLAPDGNAYGVKGISYSNAGTGVYGYSSATTGNTYGVYGHVYSTDGTGVYGTSPNTGVKGVATAGIGFVHGVTGETQSPSGIGVSGVSSAVDGVTIGVSGVSASAAGFGVFGKNTSATGVNYGVYGRASSPDGYGVYGSSEGTGVYGYSTATTGGEYGVKGESVSTKGVGVYGINNTATGHTQGVWGYVSSPDGIGVTGENASTTGFSTGVSGTSISAEGTGIYGINGATTGDAYGVQGLSYSSSGTGVFGNNIATTGYTFGVKGLAGSVNGTGVYGDGGQYGVYGESNSSNGTGVYGVAERYGVSGISTSAYGAGVYGWGSKYGVYGECPNPSGYAGYFSGILAVTGNVGIGVINPDFSYMLDVAGSINLNKGSTGGAIYCNGSEALWFDGNTFSWGYESQLNYFARPVAIGINDYTGYMLTVNGTAAKPGGGSWTTWSDSRLKDIQGNYEKGLKEIIALKPVKFNYKEGNACNLPSDQNYVGFIAQDVQKIFPEAVSEGKDGYLSLDANAINVALVNAIKELKAENDKLKADNKQFEDRLAKIEKLLGERK